MNAARRMLVCLLISWLALLIGGAAVLGAPDEYGGEVLFSLPFENPEKPILVGRFKVASENMIFLSRSDRKGIVRLNRSGEEVASATSVYRRPPELEAQPEELAPLGSVYNFAALPDGRLFVTEESYAPAIQAFDASGVPQEGSKDTFRAHVLQALDRSYGMYQSPQLSQIDTDQFGDLFLHVSPAPTEYNVALVKFDSNLDLVGVVPGYMVGWDGRTYGFSPSKGSEPNDRLRIWSRDGEPEGVITLRPPNGIADGEYDYKLGKWRSCTVEIDGRGDIYMVHRTRRPRSQWIEVLPGTVKTEEYEAPRFAIADNIVIHKFTHDGQFTARLALRGLPYWMDYPIAVDPAGNIYHLEYYKDHVDFVKETLVISSP